jgi:hypothetical protein
MNKWIYPLTVALLLLGTALMACVTAGRNEPHRQDFERIPNRFEFGDRMGGGRFIH